MGFFFEDDFTPVFLNFFILGLSFLIEKSLRDKGRGSVPEGLDAGSIRKGLLACLLGSLGAGILVSWVWILIDNTGHMKPFDYLRVYMQSLKLISFLTFIPLLALLGYLVNVYGKLDSFLKILRSIPVPLVRKSKFPKTSVKERSPEPSYPGKVFGEFFLLAGLVIATGGAYIFIGERLSEYGDGLGLVFVIFCYPIGLLVILLGVCFLRNKSGVFKFLAWVFGVYSVIQFGLSYFSPWAVSISAARIYGGERFLEYVNPFLSCVFLYLSVFLNKREGTATIST